MLACGLFSVYRIDTDGQIVLYDDELSIEYRGSFKYFTKTFITLWPVRVNERDTSVLA